MVLSDQHKALLITALIAGSVLLLVFSLSIKREADFVAESYYELEPVEEETQENTETPNNKQENNSKAETNKAHNSDKASQKRFAQAYSTITPPDDDDFISEREAIDIEEALSSLKSKYKNKHVAHLQHEDLALLDKANTVLENQKQKNNNANSSMSFSLKGRSIEHYNTPVYLCETGGKVVITITVNASGTVTDAYLNTSSTSTDACLVEHAIQYAKQVSFNSDMYKKSDQVGSITFNFIGK